jgi:hypothetical protein
MLERRSLLRIRHEIPLCCEIPLSVCSADFPSPL